MTTITLTGQEADFLDQYIKTAFWAAGREPQDLHEECRREATIDCLAFLSRIDCYLNSTNTHQAAHVFYMSRNGLATYADKFQAIAEGFGPTNYCTAEGELLS